MQVYACSSVFIKTATGYKPLAAASIRRPVVQVMDTFPTYVLYVDTLVNQHAKFIPYLDVNLAKQ